MAKKKVVIQAPLVGVFGDEIQVGDQVAVVTTGYSHRVNVRKGIYKGYVESTNYNHRAKIEITTTRSAQFKPDGTEFSWNKDYNAATWDTVKESLTRRVIPHVYTTTLTLNRIAAVK